jgi:hypothetical protein
MSSEISSPPSTYSFDVVGDTIRTSIQLSAIMIRKLSAALMYASQCDKYEHHTVRYVMMILSIIFYDDHFNILPQLRTWVGCYPDIGVETFHHRPGQWRETVFTCSDLYEVKPASSGVDPFIQLHKGVPMQHGVLHYSRGMLVGIVGLRWRFQEYHLVKLPNQDQPHLLTMDFHEYHPDYPRDNSRPKPSKVYAPGDYMDFNNEEETRDIINILIWRSQKKKTRDLCFLKRNAGPLPKSFTHSTLNMGIITDEDKNNEEDKPVLTREDYEHLIPYLTGQDTEMSEIGGVHQEGDRMEED